MNQMIIIGYVGRDPEMTYTPQGSARTVFSIADSSKKGDQQQTTWYNVTLWNGLAESASKLIHKGSQVFVSGRLEVRTYTKQDGTKGTGLELQAEHFYLTGPKNDSASPPADSTPDDRPAAEPEFPF